MQKQGRPLWSPAVVGRDDPGAPVLRPPLHTKTETPS